MTGSVPLTICIPTFNRKKYLRNCLQSLLSWIPKEWEIVVGDNASTDDTLFVVAGQKHIAQQHNLRYFLRESNIGAEANLFSLYHEARGEYVTYLADDDELDPEAFLAAFETLRASGKPALYAPWQTVDKVSGETRQFYTLPDPQPTLPLAVFKMICLGSVLPEIGIYRREVALEAFKLSPFAYWAFVAYANFRAMGTPPLLSSKPFYRNILRHYEGEKRQTLGTKQCISHLGEYRGGLEYLLAQILKEEGKEKDMDAVSTAQLWISSLMGGRVEVAARISGDPVLEQRFVSFGGRA